MNDSQKHALRLLAEARLILDRDMVLSSDLFNAEKKCENALCIIRSLRLEATGQPKPKVGD